MSLGTDMAALNFPLYITPRLFARYMSRHWLFAKILQVEGAIIEGGVGWGGGLVMWAQLSLMLEPANATRRIVGFDIFSQAEPFPAWETPDTNRSHEDFFSNIAHLKDCMGWLANQSKQPNRIEVIQGNAVDTIPEWIGKHPYLPIALLYLDFDVYAPTAVALQHIVPRMPRGAVVAFDECSCANWPGETVALRETLELNSVRLQRLPWCSTLAFFEVGA